jgi:hypothetical protein
MKRVHRQPHCQHRFVASCGGLRTIRPTFTSSGDTPPASPWPLDRRGSAAARSRKGHTAVPSPTPPHPPRPGLAHRLNAHRLTPLARHQNSRSSITARSLRARRAISLPMATADPKTTSHRICLGGGIPRDRRRSIKRFPSSRAAAKSKRMRVQAIERLMDRRIMQILHGDIH